MHHEQSTGTQPIMHAGPIPEFWALLTEEQKSGSNENVSKNTMIGSKNK